MHFLMWFAALVAAFVHVLIFCMESLWWTTPGVRRRFRQSPEQAEATRVFAFNQGFYNLFLGLGIIVGVVLAHHGRLPMGMVLITWCCLSMVGAALVLIASAPGMLRGALIQGVPPLAFLVVALIHHLA